MDQYLKAVMYARIFVVGYGLAVPLAIWWIG